MNMFTPFLLKQASGALFIFLLGRLMVSLSVSFPGLSNFFLSNLDICQFFVFRSNYLIIWDYLVCQ